MKKILGGILGAIVSLLIIGIIVLLAMGQRGDAGRNTVTTQIGRPPARIFPWITDPDLMKQWIGGLVASTPLTEKGLAPGARWRDVIAMGNKRYELQRTVVDVEPPVRVVLEVESEGFTVEARYDLVASSGGTFFSYVCISRYEHPMAKLMEPLVTRAAQKKIEADVARLKSLIEDEPWSAQ